MTTEEKLKMWEARADAYRYEIFENCSETYRDDGLAQGIIELIDLLRRQQRVIELKNEALGKMANHNGRRAMDDRPGMTGEAWAVDRAFADLAKEALEINAESVEVSDGNA